MSADAQMSLVVRRRITASPERVFAAWTSPAELLKWWGPRGVRCIHAEMDMRVGGRYRISNETASGEVINIVGQFLSLRPPDELVYDWSIEATESQPERVTVLFKPLDGGTEVVVIHERIGSGDLLNQHKIGWEECLEGLARNFRRV